MSLAKKTPKNIEIKMHKTREDSQMAEFGNPVTSAN